jgi:septum formation topological specificity factor MinE
MEEAMDLATMETPVRRSSPLKGRPQKESHRLRITLAHRRRTLSDAERRVEALKAEIARIEADIERAAEIESKVKAAAAAQQSMTAVSS